MITKPAGFLLRVTISVVAGTLGGLCLSLLFLAIGLLRSLAFLVSDGQLVSSGSLAWVVDYVTGFAAGGLTAGLLYPIVPKPIRPFVASIAAFLVALRIIIQGANTPAHTWDPTDTGMWIALSVLLGVVGGAGFRRGLREAQSAPD